MNYTTSSCINYTQTLSIMILHIYSYLYHGYNWSMQMLCHALLYYTCARPQIHVPFPKGPRGAVIWQQKGGAHTRTGRTCDSMCSAVRHKSMVVTESWSRLDLDHLLHFSPFHFLASRTHHGRKCSHGCVRWADDEHQWWKKGTGRSGTNPRRPHLVGFHSCCV